MFEESKTRSIVKAISWRVLATLITTLLVFTFTGRLDVALTVGRLRGGRQDAVLLPARAGLESDLGGS